MLTPEQLDRFPDNLVRLYSQAELDIIRDMARRISTYDFFIPSAEFQYKKLIEMGNVHEEILLTLSQMTPYTKKELEQLMKDAGVKAIKADDAIYEKAGLKPTPLGQSPALLDTLEAGINNTGGLFENLTRTTAQTGSKQFEHVLDRAYMQITSGAFDYNTAIRNAIKELARNGVAAVEYPNGHINYVESAVRRAVLTGVNQTALKMQEVRADEMGSDLVETSAHAGARPSHVLWQGRIFSRSGNHPKYPNFKLETGYGTGPGLGGWNCRHSFFPFFEGISEPSYTEEQLDEYKDRIYEYNGEKLTEYEASQKQRAIERNIRKWKREADGMGAAGLPTDEAESRVRYWQEKQRDFIKQTGLKRQRDREQIHGSGKSGTRIAPAYLVKNVDKSYNADKDLRELKKAFDTLPPKHKIEMEEYVKETIIGDSGNSRYNRQTAQIYIRKGAGYKELLHELGHAVESKRDIYRDKDFLRIITDKFGNLDPMIDTIEDTASFSKPVRLLQTDSGKFISDYQRRIYEQDMFGDSWIDYSTMKINVKALQEYFPEGYREYFMNPDNLREKDVELYNFIEGVVKNG